MKLRDMLTLRLLQKLSARLAISSDTGDLISLSCFIEEDVSLNFLRSNPAIGKCQISIGNTEPLCFDHSDHLSKSPQWNKVS